MGNAFCRKDSLPTDIEYKDAPEFRKIMAEEGANSGNNSNTADDPTDNLSSASSELLTVCDEDQHVQFAKRAMDFHNGWTPEVEKQLARIFRLNEDQIERLKEKSKNFERGLSEEEQQVEFAKKAMQIHKGWNMNVEQDVNRIFRLNEEQLGSLKVRTLDAVKVRKKAFRVRWLDDCAQIGDIVQFNEEYFSEQLTSLTNIPTTTDAKPSKLIDEFSEPHQDIDADIDYRTGDEVYLVELCSDTDLNDKEGVVAESPSDKGKYLVQLHESGEEVLVMKRHLSSISKKDFHAGDEIRLVRLSSDADLNDEEGVVMEMPNDKGKYLVQLHKSGEKVLVMERNLGEINNNVEHRFFHLSHSTRILLQGAYLKSYLTQGTLGSLLTFRMEE